MKNATIVPWLRAVAGHRSHGVRRGLPNLSIPYYDVCNSAYVANRPERRGAARVETIERGIKPHHRSEGGEGPFAKLPIQQA